MGFTRDSLYNMDMDRAPRLPWLFPLLALTSFLLGVSYVFVHLTIPYDGARLGPGEKAWLEEGVQVSPLTEQIGGLHTGDVVIAVEGRPLREWAQAIFSGGSSRRSPYAGQSVTYSILRRGQPMTLQVPETSFPIDALFSQYWGVYALVVSIQLIMTYVLLRRPDEQAARALFVFAWSLWHFPAWTKGLQVSDIVGGTGYWLYRAATSPAFLLTFSAVLHTSLVFPRRHPIVEKHPRIIPFVYLAPYGLFLAYMLAMRIFTADTWNWMGGWNAGEWAVAAIYVVLFAAVAVANYLANRDAATRLQFRWLFFALLLSGGSLFFLWLLPGAVLGRPLVTAPMLALLGLPIPLGLAIAILRYRLFDIDLVINRTLLYGTLTISTMAIYIFLVGYIGDLLQTRDRTVLAFLATGLVAVLFQPMRERLQRLVNRWMYGERDDPYAALTHLGRQLEGTVTPDAILPAIVDAVANALKLPYVAVALRKGQEMVTASSIGQPVSGSELKRLPLVHQNEEIGQLILAPRAAGESFTTAEMRLLTDLARQVEVAAHNVRLTADLRKSRERIVTAREEERRRLRRDLHDGLGPTLASLTLKLDAARNQLKQNPDQTDILLVELKSQTQSAIEDIRRLVYNLRPPALDDLGLFSAIQEYATSHLRAGLSVRIDHSGKFPKLPAAVEVAAYRIVCEALTNASKHSRATECTVRLRFSDGLQIDVQDNGIGLPQGTHSGVGMFSMGERAAELGGIFSIHTSANGVKISAQLPCEVSSDEP